MNEEDEWHKTQEVGKTKRKPDMLYHSIISNKFVQWNHFFGEIQEGLEYFFCPNLASSACITVLNRMGQHGVLNICLCVPCC